MNQYKHWPEAEVEKLKQLVNEGLSSSVIGLQLKRTRDSIIGKIHRLGLSGRAYPRECKQRVRKTRPAPKPRALRVSVEKIATIVVQPAASAPFSKALLIDALTARTCKWMNGDPKAGGTFCGHDTLSGKSWCPYHYGRAYA